MLIPSLLPGGPVQSRPGSCPQSLRKHENPSLLFLAGVFRGPSWQAGVINQQTAVGHPLLCLTSDWVPGGWGGDGNEVGEGMMLIKSH